MYKVTKCALAAGMLALVACSGKGSTDAVLTGDETSPDANTTSYCLASNDEEPVICGSVPKNLCKNNGEAKDKFTYMIVSACPPGAKKQCTSSIYGEISVYDDEISCSDIADDDGDELDIAPISNSGSIGSICDDYTQVCSGVYGCFDDGEVYSCTSSSCTKISESDAMSACGFEY
ncbi:MAG: hypothetical protein KIG97_00160 [Fibrobacter sp.]|uniref:hypothetical protein n=1 Tax=Fibrobacter sp. TaxID=35828 RepID=UPI0025BD9D6B|nr:hypothetical protein [Fibrobacter sp.]MBS7270792.1 hypothetical protein [Fibrobacter sp.]